jgi:hypothetical protein
MAVTNNCWNSQNPAQVAKGGTGIATATAYSVICAGTTATGAFQSLAALGNAGEVLTSAGPAALPAWQAAGGGGMTWTNTTVNANIAVNNGYIANKGGLLTMTLPAASAVGTSFGITNINTAAGWIIAQGANQYIRMGNLVTTVGAGGSLAAAALGDGFVAVCTETDLGWVVIQSMGNITLV